MIIGVTGHPASGKDTALDYLASKGLLNKIEISGFGSVTPIASNDTEEGRSKNRRVEFTITKQ